MAIHMYLTTRTPSPTHPEWIDWLEWMHTEKSMHITDVFYAARKPAKHIDLWDEFQNREEDE